MTGPACPTCGYKPTQPGDACACPAETSEQTWERIKAMSPDELDNQLRSDGIDPNGVVERVFKGVAMKLAKRNRALREREAALVAMLRELEWEGEYVAEALDSRIPGDRVGFLCVAGCGGVQPEHDPDCAFAALLSKEEDA